jgi:hypothetical protein
MEEVTIADAVKRGNPVCFFDIAIAGVPAGRIQMELFKNTVPRVLIIWNLFYHLLKLLCACRLLKISDSCAQESLEKMGCPLATRAANSIAL